MLDHLYKWPTWGENRANFRNPRNPRYHPSSHLFPSYGAICTWNTTKYHQIQPNTTKYNQINPNKSEWNQIKPDTIKYNKSKISPASSQLLPSYGAFCTWNTTKYHQIQPNTAKYSQSKILLRMVWNGDKIGRVPFLTPWPPLTPSPLGGVRWCPKKNWWEKCFF